MVLAPEEVLVRVLVVLVELVHLQVFALEEEHHLLGKGCLQQKTVLFHRWG